MSPERRRLGLLALGETPRTDVAPTLQLILGDRVVLRELGGLDGLDPDARRALCAGPGEAPLETRLRSGASIALARERLLPRLIDAAGQLAGCCDRVLLLCSGAYPALVAACPDLIQPVTLLRGVLAAAAGHRRLGLIGPAGDLDEAPGQWRPYVPDLVCAAASPYAALAAAEAAGRDLAARGARLIFLDCMGFTEAHRQAVARAAGLPVLCATTLTARALCEIL